VKRSNKLASGTEADITVDIAAADGYCDCGGPVVWVVVVIVVGVLWWLLLLLLRRLVGRL
jgi:hypothetical protein